MIILHLLALLLCQEVIFITETIVSEILRRMDLSPEEGRKLETVLYLVLNNYEIEPRSTEVRTVNDSWQEDLQRFLERLTIKSQGRN